MRFVKMQALGNDYVYVDMFNERLPEDPATLAVKLSDRHTGIGADGLILIEPSDTCDVRMRMFNSDGSEGSMCGNGIRCVGKYAYDSGLCRKDAIKVETASGVKELKLSTEGGICTGARVDMGIARLDADVELSAACVKWRLKKVSMGNPHAVCFLDELPDDSLFFAAGPELERNAAFENGANIEFCKVVSRTRMEVRVWERGSGETLACGTGACAAAVAGFVRGLTEDACVVKMPGGELNIEIDNDMRVYMTGPAELCFTGIWPGDIAR
ncbi:MAG: diaminopimelate epimerase [Clostridia bacterium]|nr:diaminopimelate epimerase [Clostridia bacterium]